MSIYKRTYFSHDEYAREDNKIKEMLAHYRKESDIKAQAAVCIFWWIVEDMHRDNYPVSKLETFADNYRCDVSFLKEILENFGLFHIENDCYVSERVKKNLKEQKERKIKAQRAAYFRWKKDIQESQQENESDEVDEETVNKIIKLFEEEFDKEEQIISVENRAKIHKITKQNKLTLEHWAKIFRTAKRGWDIKGKNKKPSFNTILEKWDSFANDDYFLAPDTSGTEQAKKKQAEEMERQRREDEEQRRQYHADRESVNDRDSAIRFLNKYFCMPDNLLIKTKTVKEYMEKYKFTIDELIKERGKNET